MHHEEKIANLNPPTTQNNFESKRATDQYTGVNNWPYVSTAVKLIAPGGEQTTDC